MSETNLCRIQRVRNRTLDDPERAFEKNAWDDVEWCEEQIKNAEEKVALNSSQPLPSELSEGFVLNAADYWNTFYTRHADQFFKDRKWLDSEFPEIVKLDDKLTATDESLEKIIVFETGCGAGSTVFPILNSTRRTFVYCCDFAPEAIRLLKSRPEFLADRCHPFVADITDDSTEWPLQESSVDFLIMLFTLSAISPEKMPAVVKRLVKFIKPGGYILFRDYGKYDLAQLRFKPDQCAGENLYVRKDGTLAYFFYTRRNSEIIYRSRTPRGTECS